MSSYKNVKHQSFGQVVFDTEGMPTIGQFANEKQKTEGTRVMVFNATFNNISVICV